MITLYYGSDAWRLSHARSRYADDFKARYGIPLPFLDGATEAGAEALERLIKYPSFLRERTGAVVNEPAAVENIADLLDGCPDDVDILLVQRTEAKPTAAAKKTLTELTKLVDTHESLEALTGAQLAAWIRSFCGEHDRDIEPSAVAELTGRVGADSWALANEMEKLCAYEPKTVTIEAVRLLVPSQPRHDEWELSNAIAARDKRGAVAALFRRVREGTPEQLLVGGLASAVRTLLMVRDMADRHLQAAAIAKATGLHPYVVSKTLRGAAAYEPQALKYAHRNLAELDRNAKEGKADSVDGLFSILLAL